MPRRTAKAETGTATMNPATLAGLLIFAPVFIMAAAAALHADRAALPRFRRRRAYRKPTPAQLQEWLHVDRW